MNIFCILKHVLNDRHRLRAHRNILIGASHLYPPIHTIVGVGLRCCCQSVPFLEKGFRGHVRCLWHGVPEWNIYDTTHILGRKKTLFPRCISVIQDSVLCNNKKHWIVLQIGVISIQLSLSYALGVALAAIIKANIMWVHPSTLSKIHPFTKSSSSDTKYMIYEKRPKCQIRITITWTNIGLSSGMCVDVHMKAFSHEIPQIYRSLKFSLKIAYLKFHSNLPAANELKHLWYSAPTLQWQLYKLRYKYEKYISLKQNWCIMIWM